MRQLQHPHKRTVVFQNVTVIASGSELAGVNANYGYTATFSKITVGHHLQVGK
ncbi:hypothetical protein [Paractinoplanes rishiriensis]|uniref:hypothetical protein n=1 Tax=Paractinoplanes rishiriensis TaxID=1050105 RepID=UPI001EF33D05|nr:hypothetical protein [Actinoplanes rishiriensis]